ncbi:hypothetical protein [Luedemannella flava]
MVARIATILCVLITTSGSGAVARARGSSSADFSMTVSPTRLVVSGDAVGKTLSVTVYNNGRTPMKVEVGKRDFVPAPNGSLIFQEHAEYSASSWITVRPQRFTIGPKKSRAVQVRVTVPRNPEVGDHQVALVFMSPAPADGGNIRINRGIGTPVYITVPGPVDDSVRLARLSAPSFALGGPIRIAATAQSTGTVHRDFRDANRLKIRVGGRTVEFPDFTVVRGATREITTDWRRPPLFCWCSARLTVPSADGQPQVVTFRIVIIPLHLVGGAFVLIAVAALVLYLARRRYRAQVLTAARAMRADEG